MTKLTLVIGNKNLSSWSFRPWLLLKEAGLTFEEVRVPLNRSDSRERILSWSPSGRVPVLLVDDFKIWDSLAIAEFVAEVVPTLWPADPAARAHGRSVAAEMHSGFADLRTFLPMDFTARFRPPGRLLSGTERDIARILAIWSECRDLHSAEGPFLFGQFTVADAMYAPVVSRFLTYAIELDPVASAYVETIQQLPGWSEWAEAAANEPRLEPPTAAPRPPPAAADDQPSTRQLRPASASAAAQVSQPVPVIRDPAPPIVTGPPRSAPWPSPGAPATHHAAEPDPSQSAYPPPHRPLPIRPRLAGATEIKPIGDGIHRRR
jgi:glutathione S-transferase